MASWALKSSQPALSRRLGYSSNVVYAWESGRRAPSAGDFFRLAARSGAELQVRVEAFLGQPLDATLARGSGSDIAALLSQLGRGRSVAELAKATHSDRGTVTRWLRGQTQPKLPELFAFVGATSQRLLEFVSLFADPEQLSCTRAARSKAVAARDQSARPALAVPSPISPGRLSGQRATKLS